MIPWSLVCVALIWGITNSLITKATKQKCNSKTKNNKFAKIEIFNWIANPLYTASVAVNLLGSVLFFLKLSNNKISIAVPLVNSLTLGITAVSGFFINEDKLSHKSIMGIIIVIIGTSLAVL